MVSAGWEPRLRYQTAFPGRWGIDTWIEHAPCVSRVSVKVAMLFQVFLAIHPCFSISCFNYLNDMFLLDGLSNHDLPSRFAEKIVPHYVLPNVGQVHPSHHFDILGSTILSRAEDHPRNDLGGWSTKHQVGHKTWSSQKQGGVPIHI